MKKKNRNPYFNLMIAVFGAIALSILFFFLLFRFDSIKKDFGRLVNILMPFIYGGVIAYLLKPICNFWEKKLRLFFRKFWKKGERLAGPLSILISMVLGISVVVVLILLVLPELINSIYGILKTVPGSIESLTDWVLQYVGDNEVLSNYVEEISNSISVSLPNWIKTTLLPGMQTLIDGFSSSVSSIVTILKNLFIGIIVAIYLLGSRRQFAKQGKMLLESMFHHKWAGIILEEIRYADQMFGGFINGKLVDSLIIGVICFVAMMLMRMPYTVLVSVIVGVTNIIPFFGPYIGAIPSALLILMVSPGKCVLFIVFIVVLQQFDGNILGPRILGNVTGLSSFWVLFAILFFGGVFGFIGMIIGVPVFAVLYDILRKLVHKGLAYRQAQAREQLQKE
ncbi:MAG: AI-2E family transporter [Candidatus Limivivens sp.]|nr:AI-2E family transporter [Candidatus Limivivens sp.]